MKVQINLPSEQQRRLKEITKTKKAILKLLFNENFMSTTLRGDKIRRSNFRLLRKSFYSIPKYSNYKSITRFFINSITYKTQESRALQI